MASADEQAKFIAPPFLGYMWVSKQSNSTRLVEEKVCTVLQLKKSSEKCILLDSRQQTVHSTHKTVYGRNQPGCEKTKKVGFLPLILWVFLTFYIFVVLIKLTMCFKQLEASLIMPWEADTKAQLSDFKLSKKLFLFMRYDILKSFNSKFKKV